MATSDNKDNSRENENVDNKNFQGVDKDPRQEQEKSEPVTREDLKGKKVDRKIEEA